LVVATQWTPCSSTHRPALVGCMASAGGAEHSRTSAAAAPHTRASHQPLWVCALHRAGLGAAAARLLRHLAEVEVSDLGQARAWGALRNTDVAAGYNVRLRAQNKAEFCSAGRVWQSSQQRSSCRHRFAALPAGLAATDGSGPRRPWVALNKTGKHPAWPSRCCEAISQQESCRHVRGAADTDR
jgi:hypothetical protein